MPQTKHHLNCCICPQPPERKVSQDQYQHLIQHWERKNWLKDGRASSDVDKIVVGGFARLWVDQIDSMLFVANHQGGYRVRCSSCGANIVSAFARQIQLWRRGGERRMQCPSCHAEYPLENCEFRPPAAFCNSALVLSDVGTANITESALYDVQTFLGECQIIYKRMG